MRRPQTKIPFAYFRRGVRNRGRPVHRIYTATPRPFRTAQALYFITKPAPSWVHNAMCFSQNGNDWWCRAVFTTTQWADFKAAPDKWAWWNANLWTGHNYVRSSWPVACTVLGLESRCIGIGPCPYVPDDSFTF